jgi:uncharacterized protein with GYD domain
MAGAIGPLADRRWGASVSRLGEPALTGAVRDGGRMDTTLPPATEVLAVPTYIALINYTDKGVQSVKDLPKRVEKARELMGETGVRMTATYLTMGRYDLIAVLEAPDDASVAKALLTIAGQGNIRTETMRAFDEGEATAIVASL